MGKRKGKSPGELLPGTLDVLILSTLRYRKMHGYGIGQHIRRTSEDALLVEEGSLYPALQRLELEGWVASEWGESSTGRRARYYRLTAAGRRQLGIEMSNLERITTAMARVLAAKPVASEE